MRRLLVCALLPCLAALPGRAAECGGSWPARRAALAETLARPVQVNAFAPDKDKAAFTDDSVRQDKDGVRLPLEGGGTAILSHDWNRCDRNAPDCEPAERFEVRAHLQGVGYYVVAGWMPRREGAITRLVDDRSGAVTLIGGRPLLSPSRRRAVVVTGDNPYTWAGTEVWRLQRPVPVAEWEQDAPAPADYAFEQWWDDDTIQLAARRLAPGQDQPIGAVLACAGGSWHLLHATDGAWLAAYRSPSGHRHALPRKHGLVIWQDGEQVFAAPDDVGAFRRWQDEDTAVFAAPAGDEGEVRVRHDGTGWQVEK